MMLPTHALWGMALALPVALLVPEFGAIALGAGFLGGLVPDLDMYVGHRKTLHYPVYYSAGAVVAVAVALLFQTGATVALAAFLIAAAVHSVSDAVGGGLELRPWEGTSDRAVYDHYRQRWIEPRRWIRYDGSPEDLSLSVAFAVPLLVTLDGWLRWLVLAALSVGLVYTAVRRYLPSVAEVVVERFLTAVLPSTALSYLPDRYLSDRSPQFATGSGDRLE